MKIGKHFKQEAKKESFYIGTNICVDKKQFVYTTTDKDVFQLNILNSNIELLISTDEEMITAIACDDKRFFYTGRSFLITFFSLQEKQEKKIWMSEKIPILKMQVNGDILVAGFVSGKISILSIEKETTLASFTDHKEKITCLFFYKNSLFSASTDTTIKEYCNTNNKWKYVRTYSGHTNAVTSLLFVETNETFLSAGKDKTINTWKIGQKKEISSYEMTKPVNFLSFIENEVLAGFEEGEFLILKKNKKLQYKLQKIEGRNKLSAINYIYEFDDYILFGMEDNTLHLLEKKELLSGNLFFKSQFCGDMLEITAISFCNEKIVVSTSSEFIFFFEKENHSCLIFPCHEKTILSVSCFDQYVLTGSKDKTLSLWKQENETLLFLCNCVGHIEAVTSVCFVDNYNVFISCSEDRTLKLWKYSDKYGQAIYTIPAHEKEINCVFYSSEYRYIFTASQDKTAKIWNVDDGKNISILYGHKKGVSSISFNEKTQQVATGSQDKTIRLWNIDGYCLKKFEGHETAISKCLFLKNENYIFSSSADGLICLWNVFEGCRVAFYEKHSDNVWAMSLNKKEDLLISGGRDSSLLIWRDCTEEVKQKKHKQKKEMLENELQLNTLGGKDIKKALALALKLKQPQKALFFLKKSKEENILKQAILELEETETNLLLFFIREWNTVFKNLTVCQETVSILLRNKKLQYFIEKKADFDILDGILYYSEINLKKLERILGQIYIVNFVLEKTKNIFD